MVEPVTPVSSTAPSNATRVDQSVSLSEPDVAWAAARQSAINYGPRFNGNGDHPHPEQMPRGDEAVEHSLSDRHLDRRGFQSARHGAREDDEHLSGETDRIGTGNLEDDVPFGEHAGYV
jgi:hypothetical protein